MAVGANEVQAYELFPDTQKNPNGRYPIIRKEHGVSYTSIGYVFSQLSGGPVQKIIDTLHNEELYESYSKRSKNHYRVVEVINERAERINKELARYKIGMDFQYILQNTDTYDREIKNAGPPNRHRKRLVKYIEGTINMVQVEGKCLDSVRGSLLKHLEYEYNELKRSITKRTIFVVLYTMPIAAIAFVPLLFEAIGFTAIGGELAREIHVIGKKVKEKDDVDGALGIAKQMKLRDLSNLLVDMDCYKGVLNEELHKLHEVEETLTETHLKRVTKGNMGKVYSKVEPRLPNKLRTWIKKMRARIIYYRSK